MMQPTWLDKVIEKVIDKADAKVIAQAIANNPDFIKAIERGLANKPKPGVMGPSYSQHVRSEIMDVLQAV